MLIQMYEDDTLPGGVNPEMEPHQVQLSDDISDNQIFTGATGTTDSNI